MPVANSGSSVLVDATGTALAGFTNAAATNIKVQDSSIYTITSGAIGSNANGSILLTKASGSVATLDSSHTFICNSASINGGQPADAPVANMALSIKGAKLVLVSGAGVSETFAPIVGDAQTQIVYRANGVTWNSVHPGVNIVGSTLVFEGGGDGHLGRHPSATVKSPNLIFKGTSNSNFVLGANQAWGTDNKPSAMDGFRFISVSGNALISIFGWTNTLPGQLPNNAFFVCKDWTYDVAAVGTRPTALLRSYRRAAFTASAPSYWGAVQISLVYLHIDLKTSLSATGALDSAYTYLRATDYNAIGVNAGDNGDDILSLRFKPTVTNAVGAKLSNCSVVVRNTNANCSLSNTIGTYRAALAASGVTDSAGQIVITEPGTKDYTSNASHRTDSIVIRNRIRTAAWHKWWEAGTKLILIADSRNGTGTAAPEQYASTDYVVSYRRAGSVFFSGLLDMGAPQYPAAALSADANYNGAVSASGLVVTYSAGVTTVTPAAGAYTLDQIYKSIIDYHATADSNEAATVLPVAQNNGSLSFGARLVLALNSTHTVAAGENVKDIVSSVVFSDNGAQITAQVQDTAGTRVTLKERTGKLLSTHVTINGAAVGGTTVGGVFVPGWVSRASARVITVQPTDQVRVAASYYGSKPSLFNILGSEIGNFTLDLATEPAVDMTVSPTARDTIEACFFSAVNGPNIEITINRSLEAYSPNEVIAGFAYYLVNRGHLLHKAIADNNNANIYTLSSGTLVSYTPLYKLRMADTDAIGNPILPFDDGYEVPLVVYYQNPTTGIKGPMKMLNVHGAAVGTAPWTQATATISDVDKAAIAQASKVAIESSPVLAATIRSDIERAGGGLHVINAGVKKASLLIPHTTNLPG